MTTLTHRRSNPVADVLSWLDREPFGLRTDATTPFVRVEDFVEEGHYVLRAEVPGLDPEKDLEVSVTGDTLTIRGERREEQKDRGHHEIHYGAFVRSVQLPPGTHTEGLTAQYTDGVLEVRVPIEGERAMTRTIPVQRTEA